MCPKKNSCLAEKSSYHAYYINAAKVSDAFEQLQQQYDLSIRNIPRYYDNRWNSMFLMLPFIDIGVSIVSMCALGREQTFTQLYVMGYTTSYLPIIISWRSSGVS